MMLQGIATFYHEQRSCRGLAITFAKGHFLEDLVSGIFGKGLSKVVGFISGIFGFDIPCFLEFARELRNLWLQQHRTIFGIKE